MNFTKRKFLEMELAQQHKKCAELLRLNYEQMLQEQTCSWKIYEQWLSWMKLLPFIQWDLKSISDRYHWHLTQAGLALKEHNLLPHIRKGDHLPKSEYLPITILLDQVRSAFNVGSIFRTCEALRLGKIHCLKNTPTPTNEKVERTAMGVATLVPWEVGADFSKLPRPIIALEPSDDAVSFSEFIFPKTFTLILGNEEYGISDELLRLSEVLVEVPLWGAKNSLNVACAFAIIGAEIRRQRRESLR